MQQNFMQKEENVLSIIIRLLEILKCDEPLLVGNAYVFILGCRCHDSVQKGYMTQTSIYDITKQQPTIHAINAFPFAGKFTRAQAEVVATPAKALAKQHMSVSMTRSASGSGPRKLPVRGYPAMHTPSRRH